MVVLVGFDEVIAGGFCGCVGGGVYVVVPSFSAYYYFASAHLFTV